MLGHEIGKWAEKNVTYGRLDLGDYELTDRDKAAWPAIREASWPYTERHKLPQLESREALDTQTLAHYEEAHRPTGDRYLRTVTKQAMKSKDGHVVECHVLRLFTFDDASQEFRRHPVKDEILYEVRDGLTDKGTCSFTNDFFTTQANKTFYFKRGRKDGDKSKEPHGFQLYKHTMRPPRTWKGVRQTPPHPGEVIVTGYFIDLSDLLARSAAEAEGDKDKEPIKVEELGVIFLQFAQREYDHRHKHAWVQEHDFLNSQYVCVYRKTKDGAAGLSTFAQIYWLKDHKRPCVYIDKEIIYRLQCGFVWGACANYGEDPADGAKIKFTLKGSSTTYEIDYEYKEDEDKDKKDEEEKEEEKKEEEVPKAEEAL